MEPKMETVIAESSSSPPACGGDATAATTTEQFSAPVITGGVRTTTVTAIGTTKDYKAEMLSLMDQLEVLKRKQEQVASAAVAGQGLIYILRLVYRVPWSLPVWHFL
jgi:hypothetical protein